MTSGGVPAWRWQVHATLASTQDAAIAAAQAGDAGRLAVLAERQSAGRGSRGRAWQSPPGNLNLSLVLRPGGAAEPGRWSLLAGVALHDALAGYAGGLMLKWPNDVLVGGAKIGGILIDSQLTPEGELDWVVIGLGANLAEAPEGAARLAGPAPAARDVAEAVVGAFDAYAGADTEAICEAWLARAHPVGTMLDVRTARRRIAGAFGGLTTRGELRLEGCENPISSAEVFL